jgi:hypothetical protein
VDILRMMMDGLGFGLKSLMWFGCGNKSLMVSRLGLQRGRRRGGGEGSGDGWEGCLGKGGAHIKSLS